MTPIATAEGGVYVKRVTLGLSLMVIIAIFAVGCGSKSQRPTIQTKPPAATSSEPGISYCTVTLDITRSNVSSEGWGTVTETGGGGAPNPNQSVGQYGTGPCGKDPSTGQEFVYTFSEVPHDPAGHPFINWTVSGDDGRYDNTVFTATFLSLQVRGDTTVTANYAP